ncbi:MAG: YheU family protein [Vulcanimicrobiota bacterium]
MLEIPYRELSSEALRGVLEEYATRGGFESDLSLDERIEELLKKLNSGKAKLMFDPEEGTTNLVGS